MGQRELCVEDAGALREFQRAAVEGERWPAAGMPHHFNLKPCDALADAGAERLGRRFLCCKARRQAFCSVLLAQAVSLLGLGVDTIEEALAEAIHGIPDALDVHQVDARAYDHDEYEGTTPALPCNFLSGGAMCITCPALLFQTGSPIVRVQHSGLALSRKSDKRRVRLTVLQTERDSPALLPWALEMKAVSAVEPSRLVRTITGGILGCGGWVLSRGASDNGVVNMLFEFERRACVEIYSLLVAAGIELSQSGHIRFTELCQCTRNQARNCGAEIASVDLEVQTFSAGVCHGSMSAQNM